MTELTKKQREVKRLIEEDFNVKINQKWLNKYLFMYSKFIPLQRRTMSQALDVILENPSSFAYFIYGCRASYVHSKEKRTPKDAPNMKKE